VCVCRLSYAVHKAHGPYIVNCGLSGCGLRLKCDGTRAETRFRLSAKRTSPFKSAGGRQFSRLLAAEVWASAVVMLDTSCSEAVWRTLATHSIRLFPLHFPARASPCAITFQLDSTILFPHYLINMIFEKDLLNTKCVFWFSLQLSTLPYFFHIISKTWFSRKTYQTQNVSFDSLYNFRPQYFSL